MTNKKITKELEFIRKAVIMACHPECESYGEALESEIEFGCEVELRFVKYSPYERGYILKWESSVFSKKVEFGIQRKIGNKCYCWFTKKQFKIIGQPITLARLLIALRGIDTKQEIQIDSWGILYKEFKPGDDELIAEWDLTKDLDRQEPETIISIAKLLGYEKEITNLN